MKTLLFISVLGVATALGFVIKVQYDWWRMHHPRRKKIPKVVNHKLSMYYELGTEQTN